MTGARRLSDDAHDALGYALGDPDWDAANTALAASLPDGRTIAAALDEGAVAMRVLRLATTEQVDIEYRYGAWMVYREDPDADELGMGEWVEVDPGAAALLDRLAGGEG